MRIFLLVSSKEHPIIPMLNEWKKNNSLGKQIKIINHKKDLVKGDILFLISCNEILNSSEIKKHIQFAKKCFENEQKIFAACWGLQITVTAAGGKCRVSPNGAHIGIAQDIKLTKEGKKHSLYSSKLAYKTFLPFEPGYLRFASFKFFQ